MIRHFKCKETEKIFNREYSKKIPTNLHRIALRKLWMLDAATNLNELKIPPSNHLEKLKRDRMGQHSIRINQQWRICFRWKENNAHNVEIGDYH